MRLPAAVGILARALRLAPPLLWMAVIALGSSSALGADRTSGWTLTLLARLWPGASPALLEGLHVALRKLGHLLEYGLLAVLWRRALAPSPRAVGGALAITVAYAALDELRQGLAPNRSPAPTDVLLDAVGAVVALAAWEGPGALAAATLRAARWATGIGAALAALGVLADLAVGRSAAPLAVSAVALGVASVSLGRAARRARPAEARTAPGPPRRAPP